MATAVAHAGSIDFGDGGAFPEIHVAQYPLDMGRRKNNSSSSTVPMKLDADGKIDYTAIVKRKDEPLPSEEDEEKVAERTRLALEKIVGQKIAAAQPKHVQVNNTDSEYIKYTPAGGAVPAKQRIIRMVQVQTDPLEPPKFKHKKAPRGPPSPPVPVVHSPPRKISLEEQQAWKIPPCISNWKNNKGYTIPLDKRLAADGRGLQQVQINDKFATLSQSLYVAEMNAREEVAKRAAINEKIARKEQERKEEMLRRLAEETRAKRTQMSSFETSLSAKEREEFAKRDRIRDERKRERERDRRLEAAGKKTKLSRDRDRDVSEKIALGLKAAPGGGGETNELKYDERLFNQSQGLNSGFERDDAYNIYDKPLFRGSSNQQIYRPKVSKDEDKSTRSGPVEFEKDEDPFGLDEFLNQAKRAAGK